MRVLGVDPMPGISQSKEKWSKDFGDFLTEMKQKKLKKLWICRSCYIK